jgi:hypothetical protein
MVDGYSLIDLAQTTYITTTEEPSTSLETSIVTNQPK